MISFLLTISNKITFYKAFSKNCNLFYNLSHLCSIVFCLKNIALILVEICTRIFRIQCSNCWDFQCSCHRRSRSTTTDSISPCIKSRPCHKKLSFIFFHSVYQLPAHFVCILCYIIISTNKCSYNFIIFS